MREFTLADVKDCGSIHSNGKTVLAFGKYLNIFRTDGSFVAKVKSIRNPYKAAFLPGNTALVDGKGFYYYISLDSGEIWWASAKKGVRVMYESEFACTQDNAVLFDIYYHTDNNFCIDVIKPIEQFHATYVVKDTLRTSRAYYCDATGVLNVLQTQMITPNDPQYSAALNRIYGILQLPLYERGVSPEWIQQWRAQAKPIVYGWDGRYTLYEELVVFDSQTGGWIDLLENDCLPKPPRYGFTFCYDSQTHYLTVFYIGYRLNIVIDCDARKRVAQYERAEIGVGYRGCLINGEFWTGSETGIIKRPFPHFDELPSRF